MPPPKKKSRKSVAPPKNQPVSNAKNSAAPPSDPVSGFSSSAEPKPPVTLNTEIKATLPQASVEIPASDPVSGFSSSVEPTVALNTEVEATLPQANVEIPPSDPVSGFSSSVEPTVALNTEVKDIIAETPIEVEIKKTIPEIIASSSSSMEPKINRSFNSQTTAEIIQKIKENDPDFLIADLSNRKLREEELLELCAALQGNTTIEKIILENSLTGDDDVLTVLNSIANIPTLNTLNLSGCKIGDTFYFYEKHKKDAAHHTPSHTATLEESFPEVFVGQPNWLAKPNDQDKDFSYNKILGQVLNAALRSPKILEQNIRLTALPLDTLFHKLLDLFKHTLTNARLTPKLQFKAKIKELSESHPALSSNDEFKRILADKEAISEMQVNQLIVLYAEHVGAELLPLLYEKLTAALDDYENAQRITVRDKKLTSWLSLYKHFYGNSETLYNENHIAKILGPLLTESAYNNNKTVPQAAPLLDFLADINCIEKTYKENDKDYEKKYPLAVITIIKQALYIILSEEGGEAKVNDSDFNQEYNSYVNNYLETTFNPHLTDDATRVTYMIYGPLSQYLNEKLNEAAKDFLSKLTALNHGKIERLTEITAKLNALISNNLNLTEVRLDNNPLAQELPDNTLALCFSDLIKTLSNKNTKREQPLSITGVSEKIWPEEILLNHRQIIANSNLRERINNTDFSEEPAKAILAFSHHGLEKNEKLPDQKSAEKIENRSAPSSYNPMLFQPSPPALAPVGELRTEKDEKNHLIVTIGNFICINRMSNPTLLKLFEGEFEIPARQVFIGFILSGTLSTKQLTQIHEKLIDWDKNNKNTLISSSAAAEPSHSSPSPR